MDITSLLPQLGLAGIFAIGLVKLYNDMRQDSLRREEQIRSDSKAREEQILADGKAREEKLMECLGKVSDTLENIDNRLLKVEQSVCIKNGVEP